MEVAPGAPNLGQTPSSPSSAQHLPQAKGSGTPCTPQKAQYPKKCLWSCCAKLLQQYREPARGQIHTPQTKPEESACPKERCSAKVQRRGPSRREGLEPLWRSTHHLPSLKKGERLALGGAGGIFFFFLPFFELSFC